MKDSVLLDSVLLDIELSLKEEQSLKHSEEDGFFYNVDALITTFQDLTKRKLCTYRREQKLVLGVDYIEGKSSNCYKPIYHKRAIKKLIELGHRLDILRIDYDIKYEENKRNNLYGFCLDNGLILYSSKAREVWLARMNFNPKFVKVMGW